MRLHGDKEWALAISPETVRMLVLKAKAVSADLSDEYEDGHDRQVEYDGNLSDTHHHDGLQEEEAGDLTAAELKELIGDLNVDEAAELIALAWVGPGDFDSHEWNDAVSEARQRGRKKTAAYLMGMPMLGDYLEDGLEALGA